MKKTIVIYGTSTGTCQSIAERIAQNLGADVIDIADVDSSNLSSYEAFILGSSTWGDGDLQDNWIDNFDDVNAAISQKPVAFFACGDSQCYPDTFCDAMKGLKNGVESANPIFVPAEVSVEGYDFSNSAAVENGHFIGLAIDDVNEDNLTDARIEDWTNRIKTLFA